MRNLERQLEWLNSYKKRIVSKAKMVAGLVMNEALEAEDKQLYSIRFDANSNGYMSLSVYENFGSKETLVDINYWCLDSIFRDFAGFINKDEIEEGATEAIGALDRMISEIKKYSKLNKEKKDGREQKTGR